MRDYYKKRRSPLWRYAAMAALALVAIVAAWQLISYGVQMFSSRSLQQELEQELIAEQAGEPTATPVPQLPDGPTQQPSPTPMSVNARVYATFDGKPEIRLALSSLWERNPDLVGWVTVEALPRLNLPIVQRDHVYYLRRDFDGRVNSNGTAFMDVTCSIWPRSDNLIVYAHNMKSGEMFGGLQKLLHENNWRNLPLSTFSTLYEKADYVPVAAFLCDLGRGPRHFNFTQTDFGDEAEFNEFIAKAQSLSEVHPPYDVRYGDKLLTLVTCHGDTDTQRLVVILRQMRADENREELEKMWR